jgi:hypothetical protein
MVPGRMCANSFSGIYLRQGEYCIGGTPELKCPDFLKILALEEKRGIEDVIDAG